jgi:hypothetical protein
MKVHDDPNLYGRVPEADEEEFCSDASKDETLCETCVYFEVDKFGVPSCCGNEYKERQA